MYFLGMCLYIRTLVNVLRDNLVLFDQNVQIQSKNRPDAAKQKENIRRLKKSIELHNEIIE